MNSLQTLLQELDSSSLLKIAEAADRKRLSKELLTDLIKFTEYFFEKRGEKFVENWHHREISDALRKVELGEYQNLLINIPPRYGKTELGVKNWIAQKIAEDPRRKFIHLSYSDSLALDNSGAIKELIQSQEYQELWPIALKQDSQAKQLWYTSKGGGLYATAAGGAITGFGAGVTGEEGFSGAIVIDDPLKVDDALSDVERNKVNTRFNTTIKSRRNNRNTPIIVIMQRLHEEDMSGFILMGKTGLEFHHLKLPAIIDNKPLWPFKHSIEDLEKDRISDPLTFSGQMMQEPSPEEGTFFHRDWFKRYKPGEHPHLSMYGAGDFAVTEGAGDFSEIGIGGFDSNEDLWFTDWWGDQTESDVWVNELLHLSTENDVLVFVGERGQIEKSVGPFLRKEMRLQSKYVRVEAISHGNKDKAVNCRSFQALARQGKVHIPLTNWGEDLIAQLLKFPNGKHDDKVDVCGLFGKLLDQTYGPSNTKPEERPQRDAYGNDDYEENWATV